MVTCEYCGQKFDPTDGAWDNSDYMCPDCIERYRGDAESVDQSEVSDGPETESAQNDTIRQLM